MELTPELQLEFENTLQPYQYRVVIELDELKQKIMALSAFLYEAQPEGKIDSAEATRMRNQLAWMNGYAIALADRINNFE